MRKRCLIHEAEGRHRQALGALERSLAIARETSVQFSAPQILGVLAATTDDPSIRANALNEGEALLQKGSLSHNYLGFYRDAMEACLKPGDWHEVERYAAALEDYTPPEPLPWSDFFIARARVLAAYGRGKRDDATMQELKRLRDEAERVGFKKALPALEAALATV